MTGSNSAAPWLRYAAQYVRKNLNFYRVHIIVFTFTPLIFAAIFYASNGEFHVAFIDALFTCVSAMTVTGLATINLSSLTGWQQAILFILMWLGSPITVSWVMVYIRRYYFAKKFRYILEAELSRRVKTQGQHIRVQLPSWRRRLLSILFPWRRKEITDVDAPEELKMDRLGREHSRNASKKIRTDMIHRMEGEPQLVDPSGWISEGLERAAVSSTKMVMDGPRSESPVPTTPHSELKVVGLPERRETSGIPEAVSDSHETSLRNRGDPDAREEEQAGPLLETRRNWQHSSLGARQQSTDAFPRTQTVEFALKSPHRIPDQDLNGNKQSQFYPDGRRSIRRATSLSRRATMSQPPNLPTREAGFGGFPTPDELLNRLIRRIFPNLYTRIKRTTTLPRVTSIMPVTHGSAGEPRMIGVKHVPYVTFDAIVGRNSEFRMLTHEQLEELGGREYRALNALLWLVAGYQIGIQLLCWAVIGPYISTGRWKSNFLPPQEFRAVPSPWFALFQVISSYTNSGMSLVDQSLLPFQKAYPMLILVGFLILAGNTAFPIFLRLIIWTITKLISRPSKLNDTLHFLLDHPRRCFLYLFPAHQTWFLVLVLVVLNGTDWVSFLVLDIGDPVVSSVPVATRVFLGLVQALCVRCAGFATVNLAALSPAVKVMYVLMMYISIYPIAMSIRSTNVYEDRSMGVYEEEDYNDENEPSDIGPRGALWGKYLGWHLRRQLAFDMWWLGLSVFLVCIVERDHLEDVNSATWFNIFTIVFEIVSAYGTVGLSLGIPTENYSFSGALRPLSKLIICCVMLRGRHRGLPVAIDRAVMLPFEFDQKTDNNDISERTPSDFDNRMDGNRTDTPRVDPPGPDELKTNSRPMRMRRFATQV